MRKSSSFKEKLYINDQTLCVIGDKIRLVEQEKPQGRFTNKNIKLSVELSAGDSAPGDRRYNKKVSTETKRKAFKVNVKEYKNVQACSYQLRQIYETVEVEDFERILKSLCTGDEYKKRERCNRTEDIIAKIRPGEVYEQCFGQHYAYLKSLINRS